MGGKKIPMNKHAAAAAERKEGAKNAKSQQQAKAEEDALWADDDKKSKKKNAKASDAAAKEREKLAKREEKKALEREEEAGLKSKGEKKLTKFQMQQELEKNKSKPKPKASNVVSVEKQNHDLMKENTNKKDADVDATGLNEAVSQLERVNFKEDPNEEQHPERRMKAAHKAYEEKMMPILKADNPGLKRSQLKEMCWKEWQKSPENPIVQEAMKRHAAMK
eukprot:TRINITY_DN33536_c0_g1_i1.p1 TRINITY_DN33536_c0_g1~~TRINITY_DN33536_c0_g1_i1.p1  ORF type:complete len:221 (+),score=103.12 TRINITY_DN33536_c0_g1_i1:47-709(+)